MLSNMQSSASWKWWVWLTASWLTVLEKEHQLLLATRAWKSLERYWEVLERWPSSRRKTNTWHESSTVRKQKLQLYLTEQTNIFSILTFKGFSSTEPKYCSTTLLLQRHLLQGRFSCQYAGSLITRLPCFVTPVSNLCFPVPALLCRTVIQTRESRQITRKKSCWKQYCIKE